MHVTKKAHSKIGTGILQRESHREGPLEIMPLAEFLSHWYQVISRYIDSNEDLPKVFNLYAIQTKQTKAEVDHLRKAYVDSYNNYLQSNGEIRSCYHLLSKNDKDGIDFLIKTKRKILLFYGLGETNMSYPLTDITVRISEWINILKSFNFFGRDNISYKIEIFKDFVSQQNPNMVEINAAEFSRAVYEFYVYWTNEELTKVQQDRRATSRVSVSERKADTDFGTQIHSLEHKGLNIGKTAQKFKGKTPVVLPVKNGQDDQGRLISVHRGQEDTLQRIARDK
jgi:hypothetical protein